MVNANIEDLPDLNVLDRLRIRQQIYLDVISKILILIESTMVLVDSLSRPTYSDLLENMTNYQFTYLYSILENIRQEKYNMRPILGLYDITKIDILTSEERKILSKIYSESQKVALDKLKILVEFYDDFRIIYGKTKHGLTIRSGFVPNSQFNLHESFLICYDRKYEKDIPKNYIIRSSNQTKNYYNVESYLAFNKKLK